MNKKHTFIKLITILIVSITVWGCSETPLQQEFDCSKDECIELNKNNYSVKFNSAKLLVEQAYKISFTSPQPLSSAELHPLNMSMSYIPLVLKQVKHQEGFYSYTADVFFGLCSEPKMTWALRLKSESRETIEFKITTHWN